MYQKPYFVRENHYSIKWVLGIQPLGTIHTVWMHCPSRFVTFLTFSSPVKLLVVLSFRFGIVNPVVFLHFSLKMNFPSLFVKNVLNIKNSLNVLNELKSSEVWGLKFIDFCNLKWLENVEERRRRKVETSWRENIWLDDDNLYSGAESNEQKHII